jgi:hypothetical protein
MEEKNRCQLNYDNIFYYLEFDFLFLEIIS